MVNFPAPRVYVNGIEQSSHNVITPFKISQGRSNPDSQPDAPQLTMSWRDIQSAPTWGDEIKIIANIETDVPGSPNLLTADQASCGDITGTANAFLGYQNTRDYVIGDASHGPGYLRMTSTAVSNVYVEIGGQGVNGFPITGGRAITLHATLRALNVTVSTAWCLIAVWFNAAGDYIGENAPDNEYLRADIPLVWTAIQGVFTAPDDAAFVTMRITFATTNINDVWHIDDLGLINGYGPWSMPGEEPPAVPVYDDPNVMYDDARVAWDNGWLSTSVRFTGLVTDITTPEESGIPGHVDIVAIDRQANLGRIYIQDSRPIEDDVTRVHAIGNLAGVVFIIHGTPEVTLAAMEIKSTALQAIHSICQSSGGVLWSDPDGNMHYGTGNHREISPPIMVIPGHIIKSGIKWNSTVADIINEVVIEYGAQSARESITLRDDISQSIYGVRSKKVTTILSDAGGANSMGALILARRSFPFSRITDVITDSDHVSNDMRSFVSVLALKVSDALYLPIPPDPAPTGLLAEWICEGWQEEWVTPSRVKIQIAVSDRARFALTVLRYWNDAIENTWQEELTRGSWLDALTKGPGE